MTNFLLTVLPFQNFFFFQVGFRKDFLAQELQSRD